MLYQSYISLFLFSCTVIVVLFDAEFIENTVRHVVSDCRSYPLIDVQYLLGTLN